MSSHRDRWRERLAQWFARHSGSKARSSELRHHLDEIVESGSQLSTSDVGSLALLSLRAARQRILSELPTATMLVLGITGLAFGLFLAFEPFVSVARLSNQAIDELPDVAGVQVEDEAIGFTALFDVDNFLLATRTYEEAPIEQVETALLAAGFQVAHGPTPSQNGFYIACCGEYDSLIVHLEQVDNATISTVTASDSDVVIAWPILLFAGQAIATVGAGGSWSAHKMRSRRRSNPANTAKPLPSL